MLPFHFARFGFTHVLGKEHWFMFLWTSCMPGFELKEISFARNTFFAINSTHIMETLRKFYAHISRSCRLLILQCATWNDNCFPVHGINFNSDALRVPHPGCALQKIWKDEPQTNKTSECQNIVISQRLIIRIASGARSPRRTFPSVGRHRPGAGRTPSVPTKLLQVMTTSMMLFVFLAHSKKVLRISLLTIVLPDTYGKLAGISVAGGTLLDGCHWCWSLYRRKCARVLREFVAKPIL